MFIICEAGVTNYGDMRLAKKQIDAAVAAKANAIKFQLWRTTDLVSQKVAKRYEKKLGYDWFERLKYKEFAPEDMQELQAYAQRRGIVFFATAHDDTSLEYLDVRLRVPFFKVGSGEVDNEAFLENVGRRRKPVFISFGFHTDAEVHHAMSVLRRAGARGVTPLHCTTRYPTPPDAVNLCRIDWFRDTFGTVGFSDHSVGWHACLAAVARGATIIEKHLTFDKNDPRSLDNPGALLPNEFKAMVCAIRDIEAMLRPPRSSFVTRERARAREWAGQAIVAARAIAVGEILTNDMICFKRPAKGGILARDVREVVGKRVRLEIPVDEQITRKYLIV